MIYLNPKQEELKMDILFLLENKYKDLSEIEKYEVLNLLRAITMPYELKKETVNGFQ